MMSDTNNLFQRLSLDESIRRTFSIYCNGCVTFTKIATAVFLVTETIWMVVLPLLKVSFGVVGSDSGDEDYPKNQSGLYFACIISYLALQTVIGAVGEGAMIKAVGDIYLQKEPGFFACIGVGARKACALLSASFLALIGICIGFMLFVFPGMYLSVTWFLIKPVIVLEGCSIVGCLTRSKSLVSGSWCYTFCTFLIVSIFMYVIEIAWFLMLTSGGNNVSRPILSNGGSLVAAIPSVVWRPIIAVMRTIMYINLRVEKEGLNAETFARDLEEAHHGQIVEKQQNKTKTLSDEMGDIPPEWMIEYHSQRKSRFLGCGI